MFVGQTGQYTADGITPQACILVGDVVAEVKTYDRANPDGVLVSPGHADIVVWDGAGVMSFKNNVLYDANGTTANSFRVFG